MKDRWKNVPNVDRELHWQMPLAALVGILIGIAATHIR